MNVQCPACREIVSMEAFTTSTEGLRFRCTACQRVHFIPNPDNLGDKDAPTGQAVATPDEPAPAPRNTPVESTADADRAAEGVNCPKCGHVQAAGDACHRCGLDFYRYDPTTLPPDPPTAAELWGQVLERPDDEALHERFLQACCGVNRLDFAARQYRVLGRQPGMATVSERMFKRLVELGQAQLVPGGLEAVGREDPKRTSRIVLWVALLLAALGIAALVYHSYDLLGRLH